MENTIFDQVAVEQIGFYPIRLIYRPGLSTQEVVERIGRVFYSEDGF